MNKFILKPNLSLSEIIDMKKTTPVADLPGKGEFYIFETAPYKLVPNIGARPNSSGHTS